MLVDHRPIEPRPIENLARIAHGERQADGLVRVESSKDDGHGEGRDLGIGDRAVLKTRDEPADRVRIERLAVAFRPDDLDRQTHQ